MAKAKAAEQVTPSQALENSILFWEDYAEDARKEKRLSHFSEAMSYAKTLRQLKQTLENESEDTMTDEELTASGKKIIANGSMPLTFADLQRLEEAKESAYAAMMLSEKFQLLTQNILDSDLPDKPAALTALASEYAGLVADTMITVRKEGAKYVVTLSERTKALLLDKLNKPTSSSGVTNFYPERKQPPPLEETLFSPSRNGKGNH